MSMRICEYKYEYEDTVSDEYTINVHINHTY